MAWRPKAPDYTVRYVDTADSVSKQFLTLADATAKELVKDRAPVPYDPEWQLRPNEYFELSEDEIPAPGLFKDLDGFLERDRFTRKALTKPRLYIVAVQSGKGTVFLGKRMAYLKVLGRQRNVFAAVWDGETFSALEESVATFAKTFDWVHFRDRLYVLDAANFHAEFRDGKAIQAAVDGHVATIQGHVTIDGAADFAERCRANVAMASKLQRVADTGIHDRAIGELKDYAASHSIDVTWNGDALVFDGSIEAQWNILKLLDEDRTDGPVSGRVYESSSKRTI